MHTKDYDGRTWEFPRGGLWRKKVSSCRQKGQSQKAATEVSYESTQVDGRKGVKPQQAFFPLVSVFGVIYMTRNTELAPALSVST